MNILVICPTRSEFNSFKETLKQPHENSYNVINSGVGKANAASATALAIYSPKSPKYDLIAVIGFAAGSSYYHQGDIVMPSTAQYHDVSVPNNLVPELTAVYQLQGVDSSVCLTGDSFITHSNVSSLSSYQSPQIYDMECAAVCQIADASEIPVVCIKYISDIPSSDSNNALTFQEFSDSKKTFIEILTALECIFV